MGLVMSDENQRRLVFHGAIVLLIGGLFGIPEAGEVRRGAPEAEIHAWRVAHDALVAGGVMLIAIGAALRNAVLSPSAATWLVGALIAVAYGAVVGLGLQALTGVHGLEPTGPPLNFIAFLGNLCVGVGTLVGLSLLIWGTRGRRAT